jgi:hypothetical protein
MTKYRLNPTTFLDSFQKIFTYTINTNTEFKQKIEIIKLNTIYLINKYIL